MNKTRKQEDEPRIGAGELEIKAGSAKLAIKSLAQIQWQLANERVPHLIIWRSDDGQEQELLEVTVQWKVPPNYTIYDGFLVGGALGRHPRLPMLSRCERLRLPRAPRGNDGTCQFCGGCLVSRTLESSASTGYI